MEDEFQNFMVKVTEIENIMKKLISNDENIQEEGILHADEFLKCKSDIDENEDLRVINSRTVINKNIKDDQIKNSNEMSKEIFMKEIEKDAKERSENRKVRNERAKTFKILGIDAYRQKNYEKAITYFGKAIEQRKDSAILWNNRGLCYMKLELYEQALKDFEWALKINSFNLKILLRIAKCHKFLKNEEKCQEFLKIARERNPIFLSCISKYEKSMCTKTEDFQQF